MYRPTRAAVEAARNLRAPKIVSRRPNVATTSETKAYQEFEDDGRMKPSAYYDRLVDVMEELFKFTLLTRGNADYLVDRYSERKAEGREVSGAAHLASIT